MRTVSRIKEFVFPVVPEKKTVRKLASKLLAVESDSFFWMSSGRALLFSSFIVLLSVRVPPFLFRFGFPSWCLSRSVIDCCSVDAKGLFHDTLFGRSYTAPPLQIEIVKKENNLALVVRPLNFALKSHCVALFLQEQFFYLTIILACLFIWRRSTRAFLSSFFVILSAHVLKYSNCHSWNLIQKRRSVVTWQLGEWHELNFAVTPYRMKLLVVLPFT